MPLSNRHTSDTLKSAFGSIETPDTGIIVAGGPSSSEVLNDLRDGLIDDVVELDRRTQDQNLALVQALTVVNQNLTAMASRLQSIEARIPSVAGSGRWLADFFSTDFVQGNQTDADVNTVYGQTTLRILSAQEKLVSQDSRGDVWIPKNAQVNYSYKAAQPDEVDWLTDENHLFALDQRADSAWFRSRSASGTVWVRVRVPTNLNANKFANCIILHPHPIFNFDIVSVEYRNPAGVYTAADLTYIEGYSTSKALIEGAGNVRLWIPQTQVTELRIRLNTAGMWGFSKISLQQVEFSPNATLVVNYQSMSPNAIDDVFIFGKDQDALAFLPNQVSGAAPILLVTVQMNQNTSNSTPVLTGIEAVGS